MARITDRGLLVISTLFLAFITFNPIDPEGRLGVAFPVLVLFSVLLTMWDFSGKVNFQVEEIQNRSRTFFLAIVGYLVMLGLSAITTCFFASGGVCKKFFSLNSVVQVMAQAQPVFEGNLFLTFITFAFVIPIVESIAIMRAMELLFDLLKVDISDNPWNTLRSGKALGAMLIVAVGFATFHVQAKFGLGASGLSSNLWIVFVFAMVEQALVVIERQGLANIVMHQIANSISIIKNPIFAGVIPASIIVANPIIIAAGIAGLLILFRRNVIQNG